MKLIASPYDTYRLGDFLLEGLKSDALSFCGASAFARRSGIAYLAPAIKAYSADRPLHLIIGIDLNGTSVEALELLLESAGEQARIFIFHNPASATFHPKLYRFEYADRWEVYGGSGNLTKGGLFGNYEIGFTAILAKGDAEDETLNDRLSEELAGWSDLGSTTVRLLSKTLIKALRDRKLILREKAIRSLKAITRKAIGKGKTDGAPPFSAKAVPAAPNLPGVVPAGPGAAAGTTSVMITFVMTLQPADAAPTPGRSPEFFIPKRARDLRPDFWGWPDRFVEEGKAINRYNVPFRFRGQDELVTIFAYRDRAEFRVRNGRLRAAANVGDIFRVRHDETSPDAVYEAEVVAQGTPEHASELARCTIKANSSPRLYGYY